MNTVRRYYLVRLETRAEVSEGEEFCLRRGRGGFSSSSRLLALARRLPAAALRLLALPAAHFHCPIDIGLELLKAPMVRAPKSNNTCS